MKKGPNQCEIIFNHHYTKSKWFLKLFFGTYVSRSHESEPFKIASVYSFAQKHINLLGAHNFHLKNLLLILTLTLFGIGACANACACASANVGVGVGLCELMMFLCY